MHIDLTEIKENLIISISSLTKSKSIKSKETHALNQKAFPHDQVKVIKRTNIFSAAHCFLEQYQGVLRYS